MSAVVFAVGPAQQQGAGPPLLTVDPFWPTLPETMLIGRVRGVAVDSHDHVWIVQDPTVLTPDMLGAAAQPPQAECCVGGPAIMEFDASGHYVQGWDAPGGGYDGPRSIHGIFVDHRDHVWLASEQEGDHEVLKFDRTGKFLLQIGRRDAIVGSNDTRNVNRAAAMFVHPRTNELFVADGYGNRRVVVFDADTGEYKRHWGAYGRRPDDTVPLTRGAQGAGAQQFNLVHGVTISRDDLVYVSDRNNHRIQVFTLDGTFVKEGFVARESSTTNGTVYGIAFSADPQQQFLYVADAANGRIRVLRRSTLEVVASFGRWGRQPGQFMVPHNLATDSHGNLYVGDIREGRLQKFVAGATSSIP